MEKGYELQSPEAVRKVWPWAENSLKIGSSVLGSSGYQTQELLSWFSWGKGGFVRSHAIEDRDVSAIPERAWVHFINIQLSQTRSHGNCLLDVQRRLRVVARTADSIEPAQQDVADWDCKCLSHVFEICLHIAKVVGSELH